VQNVAESGSQARHVASFDQASGIDTRDSVADNLKTRQAGGGDADDGSQRGRCEHADPDIFQR